MANNRERLEGGIESDVHGAAGIRVEEERMPHAFHRDKAAQDPPPGIIAALYSLCSLPVEAEECHRSRQLVIRHPLEQPGSYLQKRHVHNQDITGMSSAVMAVTAPRGQHYTSIVPLVFS